MMMKEIGLIKRTGIALVTLALAITFLLGGCAGDGSSKDSAEGAFVRTQQGYITALAGATAYMSLPRCPQPTGVFCSDQPVVDKIAASIKTASVAMDQAETALRSPSATASTSATAITAVNAALATLNAAVPAFTPGVK